MADGEGRRHKVRRGTNRNLALSGGQGQFPEKVVLGWEVEEKWGGKVSPLLQRSLDTHF